MRQGHIISGAAMTAMAVLSGCAAQDRGLAEPPRAKPATLPLQLEGPTADTSVLAGISTKNGELMILENDGTVTTTKLDSARGQQALGRGGDAMFNLSDVLVEDESIIVDDLPKPPTAQEIAMEEFAKRRRSALPAKIAATPPEAFLGATVTLLSIAGQKTPQDLVAVHVQLREGVDESAAFAYATCTLAAWARTTDTPYARHIRTIGTEAKGTKTVESIFTMSKKSPIGLRVMEREQTLRDCRAHGIPARVTAAGPVEGTDKNG
ncbi:hypothetical protein FQV27_08010 [Paracoccus aurantiacus]|uniref:Lipoprotein n=1 Tax=Paracoccus aurantiacus TaxID=2599412 RepID=A0A5C6S6I9_9RHOB|nr:hypothetical protein [Paracoccus aurantiacus]TXB70029.1 hypothetical protein FQV27_08010 [Paracoccus aurantiacus]